MLPTGNFSGSYMETAFSRRFRAELTSRTAIRTPIIYRMAPRIKEKDLKLLWSRSGNRCAFASCRTELTIDSPASPGSFPLGEQAHIVGEAEAGPRGNSDLPINERNSYFNLILLCPNHHTVIDKDADAYTVKGLHEIKETHELWVRETLGPPENPSDLIYASLIDHAVEACQLERWNAWASLASSTSSFWEGEAPDRLHDFRARIMAAIWPGALLELECSLDRLSEVCFKASDTFTLHAEHYSGTKFLRAVSFYRQEKPGSDEYVKALEDFGAWTKQCDELIVEATKAANWFAEVVRRDFDPLFFAVEGKFLLTTGPYEDLSYRTDLPEYTAAEKQRTFQEYSK